jgi:hypothetical protein
MYFTLHQISQSIIHEAMAANARGAREARAHEAQCVMAAASRGTGVSGMQRAVVHDLEVERLERLQTFPHAVDGTVRHR